MFVLYCMVSYIRPISIAVETGTCVLDDSLILANLKLRTQLQSAYLAGNHIVGYLPVYQLTKSKTFRENIILSLALTSKLISNLSQRQLIIKKSAEDHSQLST